MGIFLHLKARTLLYAGLLHDVGKAQTPVATLSKTSGWTEQDQAAMVCHVMDGYRMIRDRFDFTAEVILWHHRFQPKRYPEELPTPLHEYNEVTSLLIPTYGRLLSLADQFDALHRVNGKHDASPLTGAKIMERIMANNQDYQVLIKQLFDADIFTTHLM